MASVRATLGTDSGSRSERRHSLGGCTDVPAAYPTIQAAIDAASPGDVICVAPGVYSENISFAGKAIWVRGSGAGVTIIEAAAAGPVVSFVGGEGPDSRLSDLTVTAGVALVGAGVFAWQSSPTLENLHITENGFIDPGLNLQFAAGAGVYLDGSSAVLDRVRVTDNHIHLGDGAHVSGGGVLARNGSPSLLDCTISANRVTLGAGADVRGGGLHLLATDALVVDTAIEDNTVSVDATSEVFGIGAFIANHGPDLAGVTIARNALGPSSYPDVVFGGGLHLRDTSPVLFDVSVRDNSIFAFSSGEAAGGGGVSMQNSHPYVVGLDVTGNRVDTSYGAEGGGMYLWRSHPFVIESVFAENAVGSVGNVRGGGVHLERSDPTFVDSAIMYNELETTLGGAFGGGLSMIDSSPRLGWTAVLRNSVFAELRCHGGGVYVEGGSPELDLVDIVGNNVFLASDEGRQVFGGGLYARETELDIHGTTIARNHSATGYLIASCLLGGGGMALIDPTAPGQIDGLTIYGNSLGCPGGPQDGRSVRGGGLYIESSVELTLRHLAVYDNSLASHGLISGTLAGAGLHLDADAPVRIVNASFVKNQIITNSTTPDVARGAGIHSGPADLDLINVDVSHNAIQTPASSVGGGIASDGGAAATYCNIFGNAPSDAPGVGGIQISVPPGYTDVADPDSTSWDLHPIPGSGLIDAGDPAILDQNGTRSDIGAFGG